MGYFEIWYSDYTAGSNVCIGGNAAPGVETNYIVAAGPVTDHSASCANCPCPEATNLGFEADAISGYVYMTPTGWSNIGSTVVVESCNGPWGGLCTPDGGYFLSIQGSGSSLTQGFCGLTPGAVYSVSFFYSTRPGYGDDQRYKHPSL